MKKILSTLSLVTASTVFAQQEPLFKPFDVQMFGGTYLTQELRLLESDWQKLNPDGFPQLPNTDKHFYDVFGRSTQGGDYRTVQVQFAVRKNNPMNKGLWLAGLSGGFSNATYASQYWQNQSDAYILDTISYSSGAPSQVLMGDTVTSTRRELHVSNAHLGFSFGYMTDPTKLFSFKVRALLDVSLSTRANASFHQVTETHQAAFYDTTGASASLRNYSPEIDAINSPHSSYSTNAIFGVGLQIPVGISWQLSSFRPILSRFSVGLEGAGGIRMIAIPKAGVYSVPTFSIGVNFAYRFKTWIPDNDNIRKIRERQQAEGLR